MNEYQYFTLKDLEEWAADMAESFEGGNGSGKFWNIYGVPRGGLVPAFALLDAIRSLGGTASIVASPKLANIIVDDIVDSGDTMKRVISQCERIPSFVACVRKDRGEFPGKWIVFPWNQTEGSICKAETIETNIRRLIEFIGEDPSREGLVETPARVAKAFEEWYSGYNMDPDSILKTFEDGASKTDEMVVIGPIQFYSHCEHHMAPFFGEVTIGYVPDGKILGLSKFPRLVEIFARRLQVQERLTTQIADALQEGLNPKGIAVLIKARHLCVESRGIQCRSSWTTTTKLIGCMSKPEARSEFLRLAK